MIDEKVDTNAINEISLLITDHIGPDELSKLLRIGAFELSMYGLKDRDHHPELDQVIYYLTELAERLKPVIY